MSSPEVLVGQPSRLERGEEMARVRDWHEEDSFWETVGPVLFPARRWEDAPREVEAMMSLLDLKPGAHVLDLCCGVGRHSLELARRAFQVTGVDRTASYLEEAQRRAAEEGLAVELVQADMRTFRRPGTFDAILNYFTSFGYFSTEEEERQVLDNAFASLRPGGRLLMDMMGKEILARVFTERGWHEEDGQLVLEERKLAPDWSSLDNRWIIIDGGERQEVTMTIRQYAAAELCSLLKHAGFERVDVYGSLGGAPYDMDARRLVVVAHKGEEE